MTARRVLIVDDDAINRRVAAALFTRLGWQSLDVESAPEAFALLQRDAAFDLLLLDISMPKMSGEELCVQIKADSALQHLPLVAYTAHAMPADIARFLGLGFNDVIVKPVSLGRIRDVLGKLGLPIEGASA